MEQAPFKEIQGTFEDAGDGVAVGSTSLAKLQAGLKKTIVHAEKIHDKWQTKVDAATVVFRCNECLKNFKSAAAVKRHWGVKSSECDGNKGFKEIADIELTSADRMTEKESEIAAIVDKSNKAAKEIAYSLNSAKANEGKLDGERLMRYPIGNFERVLREADTSDLEDFVKMRFSGGTAPKKILAQKELDIRSKKNAKD